MSTILEKRGQGLSRLLPSFFICQRDIIEVSETFSAEEGLEIIGLCVFYFSQAEIQSSTTITKTKALQSSNHFPLLLLALLMRVVMRAPLRTPAPKRRPLLISSFLLMYGSSKSPAYIRLRGISHLWCNTIGSALISYPIQILYTPKGHPPQCNAMSQSAGWFIGFTCFWRNFLRSGLRV